jgi:hypothetical protein
MRSVMPFTDHEVAYLFNLQGTPFGHDREVKIHRTVHAACGQYSEEKNAS